MTQIRPEVTAWPRSTRRKTERIRSFENIWTQPLNVANAPAVISQTMCFAGTNATVLIISRVVLYIRRILRVKWRHRIYGHDAIVILWVWNAEMNGDRGRRFIVLFKCNSTSLFKEASMWLTCQRSLFNGYHCSKHFSELYPRDVAENQLA